LARTELECFSQNETGTFRLGFPEQAEILIDMNLFRFILFFKLEQEYESFQTEHNIINNLVITILRYLKPYSNQINGSNPFEIWNLANLEALDPDSNNISGSIHSRVSSLTILRYLNLSSNQIN